MIKWRKKPIIVEAKVYEKGLEDGFARCGSVTCGEYRWFDRECSNCEYGRPYIDTLEGRHYISTGDYIITGVRGERYPCKPDIFHMTYEKVGEGSDV